MKRLKEVVGSMTDFDNFAHADRLRLFAWVLHADGREHIQPADLSACFDVLHVAQPGNLHRAIQALVEQGDLIRSAEGYRLSRAVRERLEAKHGNRPITVQVHELLQGLPGKVTVPSQHDYLDEAIRCFRAGSWRAAAIMAWNVAFDQLCQVIVAKDLVTFNAEYAKAHPKKPLAFQTRADLQELKESEVIRTARAANITNGSQHKCLERNLQIRNDIAHPSGAPFTQLHAEPFIIDVVEAIVLGLRV